MDALAKKVYLQFEMPQNHVRESLQNAATSFAVRLLTKIIPQANPDFDDKIDDVKTWLVEFDAQSGIPQREIGLNAQGRAVVKMPHEKNCGYWTDNNLRLADFRKHFKTSEITPKTFEEEWDAFGKVE